MKAMLILCSKNLGLRYVNPKQLATANPYDGVEKQF